MDNNKNDSVAWGSTEVTYEVMTDSTGEKWCVPTKIDGEPVEYLRKYDKALEDYSGTFVRFTPHPKQ